MWPFKKETEADKLFRYRKQQNAIKYMKEEAYHSRDIKRVRQLDVDSRVLAFLEYKRTEK